MCITTKNLILKVSLFEEFPESIVYHIHLGNKNNKTANTLEVKYQDCHINPSTDIRHVIALCVSKDGKTFYHASKLIEYTKENLNKYRINNDF